ncbi:hypothetical protein DPMN_115081 [Dreissena polymorpha]|uniref:Uncharacterized protein n=1 Tax=Dreissena polymorpha TaxID=45954 RepID=A0A9D4KKJ6_DREPO|nr:hypothetical protein DPMN_115081 [Dreissena polymorpha]
MCSFVTLEGGHRRGHQKKSWMENVKEWTSLPIDKLLIADHETTKAGLVWTRHQTRLTMQDCAIGFTGTCVHV